MTERDYTAYFEQPEFKAVLARYEAMKINGEKSYFDPEQLTDIAEYYATRNREQEAERVIDYALAIHPGSTDPLIFKARTYMLKGEIQTAYLITESIPDQKDREVTFLYAELLLNEGKLREAERLLIRELLAKEYLHQEYVLTVQDIVELYLDYAYTAEATCMVEKTLKKAGLEEWEPQTRLMVQKLYVDSLWNEGRLDEAVVEVNRILDEDPYDVDCWLNLGNIYNQKEDFNSAIDALDFALAIAPDCLDALFTKGHSYAILGNEEKALQTYRTCLERGFDKAMASYTCGVMETVMGLFDEAIRHLSYAYSVYGNFSLYSFSICFNLALVYIETGDMKRAAEFYHLASQIDPDDEGLEELLDRIR